jgi:hypothetical protein
LSEHNLKSKSFKNKPIPYPIHTAFNNMPNNVIIKNKFEIIVLNFYNFDNAWVELFDLYFAYLYLGVHNSVIVVWFIKRRIVNTRVIQPFV